MGRMPLFLFGGALVLSGCESGPGIAWGDPELEVIGGDGQVHAAAVGDTLDAPVAAQIFRKPDGGITFRFATPAYAQTQVQGVPNEQVCAVPVGTLPLQPWVPCDNTHAN